MCMYINTYYEEMQFCLRNLRHLQQLQIIVQGSVYWGRAKQPLPITFLSVCPFDMTNWWRFFTPCSTCLYIYALRICYKWSLVIGHFLSIEKLRKYLASLEEEASDSWVGESGIEYYTLTNLTEILKFESNLILPRESANQNNKPKIFKYFVFALQTKWRI